MLDGATRMRVLRDVVLPLAAPGIASTAILTFLYCWNEFLFALSFTLGPDRYTVPVAITLFRGRYQVPWGEVLAATVVATVPVALLSAGVSTPNCSRPDRRCHEGLSSWQGSRSLDSPRRIHSGHVAIHHLDLRIEDGEFLVCVGPSGCGKSTLLRLIAGLETPTAGRIVMDDGDVTALSPQARDLAMVFQSYALYPHMSVRDNLAYGLKARRTDRAVVAERVADVAAALDIERLLDRRPAELSGGQRQRVALGRAMVRQPKAFLLDDRSPTSILAPRAGARAAAAAAPRARRDRCVHDHDQKKAMAPAGASPSCAKGPSSRWRRRWTCTHGLSTRCGTFHRRARDEPCPCDAGWDRPAFRRRRRVPPARCRPWRQRPVAPTVDLVEPRGHDSLSICASIRQVPTRS